MVNKPSLLLISALSPLPIDSGGATRLWQTIDYLSQHFELDFIFFKKNNQSLKAADQEWLKQKTNHYHQLELKEPSRTVAREQQLPFRFTPWWNLELKKIITEWTTEKKYSRIQVELSQLAFVSDWLPTGTFKVLTAYDVNAISFERRAREQVWYKRGRDLVAVKKIAQFEQKYLPQFDQLVAMSAVDRQQLHQLYDIKLDKIKVIPNGIALSTNIKKNLPLPLNSTPLHLGFIGSFNHPPNLKAVEFFLKKIAPLLEKAKINYQFVLAGDNDPQLVAKLTQQAHFSTSKLINLGWQENLQDFYQQIEVLVAPLQSGSGTRLKILEALAFGLPVVTTAIGAEGIEWPVTDPQLVCVEQPTEFAQAIINFEKKWRAGELVFDPTNKIKKYEWSEIFN